MGVYRKRPVVVEARQWQGTVEQATDLIDWIILFDGIARYHDGIGRSGVPGIAIDTLEGMVTASPGDWIVKGVKDEFYPCKPDIFDLTYEVAE